MFGYQSMEDKKLKMPEVTEINDILDYDVFEKVKDEGQETLGSKWVVTAKEKHDGQNRIQKQDW